MIKRLGDGGYVKYLCPNCGGDNVGESGLGGGMLHCFGPCMTSFSEAESPTAPIKSEEELQVLSQEPY